mgnify:CR=1 FL=1
MVCLDGQDADVEALLRSFQFAPGEVGILEVELQLESPNRGTLTHHYWTDEKGILTKVNLIVGTTNNYAPMAMSVKNTATSLIQKGTVITEGLLNRVEMAFRSYDPCMSCATHSLPGQMPLEVTIRDNDGEIVDVLSQYVD